jgi:ribosomal-protein-alanine N-acetyltransferase
LDPSIQVQPFQPSNLDRIVAIEQASFGDEAWDAKLLLEYFHNSPELFFIAKIGRRIAGYIVTVNIAGSRSAELVSIAVDPRDRRRGVGKALLDATSAQLRSRRIKTWWLMAGIANETAIGFYERYGFTRTRLVKRYYGAKRDAWRMRMTL